MDETTPRMADWRRVTPSASRSLIGGLSIVLAEAEDQLALIPRTAAVQELWSRLGALKTVTNGLVHGIPRLTEAQRARLVIAAHRLGRDVAEMRARAAPVAVRVRRPL